MEEQKLYEALALRRDEWSRKLLECVNQMLNLAGNRLTTLLFHRFFFEGELPDRSRDRLKRQCEWLCRNYTPMDLNAAVQAVMSNRLPKNALAISIDDAKVDILRVADIFSSFAVPIAVFVCAGWCAAESRVREDDESILARIISKMEWYRGPAKSIGTARGTLSVGAGAKETATSIDLLIANREELRSEFGSVLVALERENHNDGVRITCCWAELKDLHASGVAIGGHSVSHVNLAAATPERMRFEISETYRILCTKFGKCEPFAYPYGMAGMYNEATAAQLSKVGFRYAFLSHSEFATSNTDPFHLPRISMPDRPMSHAEFCARAAGAGVLYRRMKQSALIRQIRF